MHNVSVNLLMVREVESVSHKRLRELGLQVGSLQGDIIVAFQCMNAYMADWKRIFTKACRNRTWGNNLELKDGRFSKDSDGI